MDADYLVAVVIDVKPVLLCADPFDQSRRVWNGFVIDAAVYKLVLFLADQYFFIVPFIDCIPIDHLKYLIVDFLYIGEESDCRKTFLSKPFEEFVPAEIGVGQVNEAEDGGQNQ